MAVALIMLVVLAAAFIGNLFIGAPLLKTRATVLLIFAASYLVLRSGLALSLNQLRLFEILIFGALVAGKITLAVQIGATLTFLYILGQEILFNIEDDIDDQQAGFV